MTNSRILLISLLLILLALYSCEEKTQIADMSLSVNIQGIPPSESGNEYYYLYLKNDEDFTYVTEVLPDADSTWSIEAMMVERIRLADAQQLLVAVSTSSEPSSSPDGPIVLGGDFNGTNTTLSIGHSDAIGDPIRSPSGQYFLYTPSLIDTMNWYSGIWMYDTTTLDTFTLLLPEINDDWEYEGWVEVSELDTFLSIGRWQLNEEPDSGNPFTSDELTPFPFQGEDFVQNLPDGITTPFDLRGRLFFITLEPLTDPDPNAPFSLVVLRAPELGGPFPRQLQSNDLFALGEDNFPSGEATR